MSQQGRPEAPARHQITESRCGRDSEAAEKPSCGGGSRGAVRDRTQCSMSGLFHVPRDGVFGGLEPWEGLAMKSTHHLLPFVPLAPYVDSLPSPEPFLPTLCLPRTKLWIEFRFSGLTYLRASLFQDPPSVRHVHEGSRWVWGRGDEGISIRPWLRSSSVQTPGLCEIPLHPSGF